MKKVQIRVFPNHKVQVAVSVVIHESTAAAPGLSVASHASSFSHFFEPAPDIVIEPIFSVICDVKIFPAVVVIVSYAYALAPACRSETRTRRHVSKSSIVIVVIQVIGRSTFGREARDRRSIHEKNIRPAVVIIIKDCHTCAGAFEDVCAAMIAARNVCCSQSCLLSHVSELGDLCRAALGPGGCSSPHTSRNDLPNYEQHPADAGVHRCTPSCFAVSLQIANTLAIQVRGDNLK